MQHAPRGGGGGHGLGSQTDPSPKYSPKQWAAVVIEQT